MVISSSETLKKGRRLPKAPAFFNWASYGLRLGSEGRFFNLSLSRPRAFYILNVITHQAKRVNILALFI